MKLKRVYLVEFRLWRKAKRRKKEPWTQTQLDLPGLPDYGPLGRPEVEARLISDLAENEPPHPGLRAAFLPRWGRGSLQRGLVAGPFVLLPLLPFAPRAWLLLGILSLGGALALRIRFRRIGKLNHGGHG